MSDDLLGYYNNELQFIRHHADRFAKAHPRVAERLRLNPDDASDDPHVERLIEAFAYLTARIRHKLDDEFPELTGSLLNVLYPHYLAPIPSMAVVKLVLDPEQSQLTAGYEVERHSELETERVGGEPCRFRTCYPVTLWPVDLTQAVLSQAPLPAPHTTHSGGAVAVLRLALRCRAEGTTFASLGVDKVRIFLKGQPHHIHSLYELIFNHTLGVAVAGSVRDARPIELGRDCLQQVGFDRDEGLLPYPPRSFLGYRLLTEYFTFPQKFFFVELNLPRPALLDHLGGGLEVYVFLNRAAPDLARHVSAETFQLGCTPAVNLFGHRAESFQLTHTSFEYPVVPDRRLPQAYEVYSVDRVTASPPKGSAVEFHPFFSIKHSFGGGPDKTFWHAQRRSGDGSEDGPDRGTEVFLSLVDQGFSPSAPANWTVHVDTTCLNRNLPQDLPFVAGDQPRFSFLKGGGLVSKIVCLTQPTPTLRPSSRPGALWKLISHLSLNHLSLVDDGTPEALREILKLYDFIDSPDTRSQVEGLLSVKSERVVGRVSSRGPAAFCRGTHVTLQFDPDRYTTSCLFLFASVLERFLAAYSTVNSFSKLTAAIKGRDEVLRQWPARMGEKILV
jgi:type VI secretion system protein ImpG